MTTIEELLEVVFSVGSTLWLYSKDPRLAKYRSVEGWQFSWVLQGRLRRWCYSWLVSCQLKVSLWREDWEAGVKWPPAWSAASWGLAAESSSARKAEKRWHYTSADSWQEFFTGSFEDRTWAREAEESPPLEAIAKKQVLKTQQARKGLAGAVGSVNCGDQQWCTNYVQFRVVYTRTWCVQKVSNLWSAEIHLLIWRYKTLIPFKVVSLCTIGQCVATVLGLTGT
jgi:hypothetical protein